MKKVQHMVIVKFKAGYDAKWPGVVAALKDLQQRLPGILNLAAGPYSSPEGLNQGFTHGILITFASAADRDKYLSHADHEKLKSEALPFLENVVAFDFED